MMKIIVIVTSLFLISCGQSSNDFEGIKTKLPDLFISSNNFEVCTLKGKQFCEYEKIEALSLYKYMDSSKLDQTLRYILEEYEVGKLVIIKHNSNGSYTPKWLKDSVNLNENLRWGDEILIDSTRNGLNGTLSLEVSSGQLTKIIWYPRILVDL